MFDQSSAVGTLSTVVAGSFATSVPTGVSSGIDEVLSSVTGSIQTITPSAPGSTRSLPSPSPTQSGESPSHSLATTTETSEPDGMQLNNTLGNIGSKDAMWSPKVVAGVVGVRRLPLTAKPSRWLDC